MTRMLYGSLGFAELLHERHTDTGPVLVVSSCDEPLQLILEDSSEAVVAADCDTLCRTCAFARAEALGAAADQALARVTVTGTPHDDPEPVLRITSTDGTVYIGAYGHGFADVTTDPCVACGAETIIAHLP